MCKTRFDSQEMILNGFKKTFLKKKLNGTRDPPPLHGKFHQNFHFVFRNLSLRQNENLPHDEWEV